MHGEGMSKSARRIGENARLREIVECRGQTVRNVEGGIARIGEVQEQDLSPDSAAAQLDPFFRDRHGEAVGAFLFEPLCDRHRPMAIAVGLDDRKDQRRARAPPQVAVVGGDDGQIDDRFCGTGRAFSLERRSEGFQAAER